ncbi:MAG TPA: CHASE2 domain-containing protein, partial [Aquabacterium sp.]|nr:CHASE2 domain-containing protein [Aquabacterium sp.]
MLTGPRLLHAAGLCLTLALSMLAVWQPDALRKADLRLYDQMLSARAMAPSAQAPVLVGIDEFSLWSYGQWPWPRYRLAQLVTRLQELGAQVVALDVLMPEPDRTAPEVIEAERHRDLVDALTSPPIPPGTDSNSQQLAEALSRGTSVLGFHIDFAHSTPQTTALTRSLPILTQAAAAEGFTNAQQDIDGTVRRTPLLQSVNGRQAHALALSALLQSKPAHPLRETQESGEHTLLWQQRRIPLDGASNMLLDYRNGPFPYLSAQAVLSGKVPAGHLKGKIVLVGAWATGLGDLHLPPSGKTIKGLEVHATIIDNILAGTFLTRPDWAPGAELTALLVVGILGTVLLARAGAVVSILTVILGSVGLYAGARGLLVAQGIHLSPLLPIMALVLISTVLSLLKYGIEARALRARTQDLLEAQDEIIFSMSVLAEARDQETGGHIRRTQRYVEILARQLSTQPRHAHLTSSDIELLVKSAPLHDIGKVGIPDDILQKPGKLSAEEYTVMQAHTTIGAQALTRIVEGAGHPEKQRFLD